MKKYVKHIAVSSICIEGNDAHIASYSEDNSGNLQLTVDVALPRYDMSKIQPHKPKYLCEDFDHDLCNHIMISPEGKEVLNRLKNQKTSRIIHHYIKIQKARVEVCCTHLQRFLKFMQAVQKAPLIGNNLISHRTIGLTKEEVWKAFKQSGLVTKFSKK